VIKFIPHFLLVCSACLVLSACTPAPPAVLHLSGPTMGTTYNVKFVERDEIKPAQLQAKIDRLLVNINQLMSTYIPDSELSRFNQYKGVDKVPLSAETLSVMAEAKRLGELSGGMLDVTLGPVINLWGFGPQSRPEKVPSEQEIKSAKATSGLDKLVLGPTWARKQLPTLYVDLSTIAKGYAVDRVAELLEEHKVRDYLVEIGGELRVSGNKGAGQDWRIAVEKPITAQRAVQRVLSIGNNGLATSGDYRIYFEDEGQRYSHLINPLTAKPITHNLVSVTVVHPSSMTADGLATALNVMGKDKAWLIAKQYNLAVLLITRENGEYIEYTSAAFEPFILDPVKD
jgi:thiamine biosynthesis lipoprotein